MFEILQNFEQAANQLNPIVLIGLGIILILAGLFVWLGGLGLARILAGVVGAVAGAICGFFIIRRTIASAVFLATVMTAVAVIFERVFFIILTAALAVAVCFAILAWPYLGIPQQLSATSQGSVATQRQVLGVGQTIEEIVEVHIVKISNKVKQICSWMPLYNWAILSAIAVVFLYLGSSFWRPASALSCATMGTVLIFAGMVLLLLYKGSAPISGICSKLPFYGSIFLVMMVAGTTEQLLLCRRAQKRSKKRKVSDEYGEEHDRTKQPWRTA